MHWLSLLLCCLALLCGQLALLNLVTMHVRRLQLCLAEERLSCPGLRSWYLSTLRT